MSVFRADCVESRNERVPLPDNPVRFIDAFVDGLDLRAAGFSCVEPKTTGRPGYVPGDLLKLYIYPFGDGNGLTARLLMNLMLIRGGYPPIAVRPEDRNTYLDALERGSLAGDLRPFQTFMHERLDSTLGEYLSTLREALSQPDRTRKPSTDKSTPRG